MQDVWTAIPVALVTAVITTLATLYLGERKLQRDYQLEFAAERVARTLMMDKQWRLRTFESIKRHLGGFEDDELRKILVRSGAIRFWSKDKTHELWGLIDRNMDRLGDDELNVSPERRLPG